MVGKVGTYIVSLINYIRYVPTYKISFMNTAETELHVNELPKILLFVITYQYQRR